jgi:hypothetical protein
MCKIAGFRRGAVGGSSFFWGVTQYMSLNKYSIDCVTSKKIKSFK